ncbi:MAG TPA: ABC transporter substrate-binding protein [Lachnospiraceae bacterium]|jgi:lactose/L-arabinose transport system substrate-binding protein|nr:ABC transporter substrate-binding protein [Lachnospiraceae bacterium]HBY71271.1 ABC transporter substrate-binding protein [Lachnospiraceae bacterium]HCA69415.1 ABC transporter substrate-binding protein [Lachnospiraceae bacterium]HCM12504.1 ABC transporter substrate-binding protein [Lachnospiraceae bacterium]HCR40972.1 ABC transporter substrate-binding protein [Lachnospiraceae bacterium]
MKKKVLLIFTLLMVSMTAFTACSKEEGSKENENEKVTLTVWSWDVALKQLEASAERFKETNPDVEFVFEEMGTEQIYAKLSTGLATGDGLGDIITLEGEQLSGYASNYPEGFLELNDIVKKDDFLPVKMGEVTVNGKVYGFPWDAGPIAMFYRTDYFEQAGVKAEEIITWEDFIEAGKKVAATCTTPSGDPVMMLPIAPTSTNFYRMLLLQLGQGFFDAEGNTILNTDASVKALNLEKKIFDSGIALSYNGWDEYEGTVANESVATIPEAVWMIGTIKDKAPQTSGKWGVMNMPAFSSGENHGATNGGSLLAINAKTKNAEMAKKFVEFAMTDEQLLVDGFTNYGLYPSYMPVYSNAVFAQGDEFFGGQKVYQTFIEIGKVIPTINYTENFAEALDTVGSSVTKVLLQDADVQETVDKLQSDLVSKFGK